MVGKGLLILVALVWLAGCKSNPEAKLHRAVAIGSKQRVETMLKDGVDVNKVVDGQSPLMAAVYGGQPKMVTLLLDNGAELPENQAGELWDLIFENPSNPYPRSGQADAAALLFDRGLEPRITVLEASQLVDSREFIEALVAKGGDVDEADENGWTALHHAAMGGREASCEALLAAGADPNVETTRTVEKLSPGDYDDAHVHWRYEAGSRPADVAQSGGSRGIKTCAQQIREAGGTQNEGVKNIKR